MAKGRDGTPGDKPRGRFSRSGHTTHRPRVPDPAGQPPPPAAAPPADIPPNYRAGYPDDPPPPRYRDRRDDPPPRYRDDPPPRYRDDPDDRYRYRDDPPPRYRDEPDDRYRYRDDPPPRYRDDSDDRYRYRDDPPPRYRDDPPPRYRDRYRDDPDDRYRDRYPDDPPPRYRDDLPPDPVPAHADAQVTRADLTKHAPASTLPLEPPTVGKAALSLGKATLSGTNRAARTVTRKVITASQADGARESGLTHLIWNQVLSYGADAMVTVALAGTVFFGASAHAQRGNVLLYLLITMAPFALVAPVIGPVLDRFQHGRRWTMAGTGVGRCILALIMAMHSTELLVLYPCALGSLVLSKAYAVVRAAAAPRLVPPGMTLTSANARVTIFGLASTVVLGGLVGAIIKLTGSYSAGLVVTAIGFAACAYFAFRLPPQVDSAAAAPRHPEEPMRPRTQRKVPPIARLHAWARRGFDPHLVVALQGESAQRLLSGMQTIYLAFYVESTAHGFDAALQLGGVVVAAGAGNFLGTAIGTRARISHPSTIILTVGAIAAAACVVTAILFSVLVATLAFLVCAMCNSLGKIALDSLIQNDVVETLRSSAFARSETFLQLAWVVGAALGVAIPSANGTDGTIAFVVAAVIVGAVAVLVALRTRATRRPGTWQPLQP